MGVYVCEITWVFSEALPSERLALVRQGTPIGQTLHNEPDILSQQRSFFSQGISIQNSILKLNVRHI